MGTNAHKNVVMFFLQVGKREFLANPNPESGLDTQLAYPGDVFGERSIGQAIGWDHLSRHASRTLPGIEESYGETAQGQIIGGRQSRRAGPHHGRRLAQGGCRFGQPAFFDLLGDESFYLPDGQWRVVEISHTLGHARVVTNRTRGGRQRIGLEHDAQGLRVFTLGHQVHVVGHILVGWTALGARGVDAVEAPQGALGFGGQAAPGLVIARIFAYGLGIGGQVDPLTSAQQGIRRHALGQGSLQVAGFNPLTRFA